MSRPDDIRDLKTALADNPDVTDDERLRIVANAWIVRVAFTIAAVLAFPFAFVLAGALMMWIDGPPGVAALCGLFAAVTSALGPVLVRHVGLGLEGRYLRGVVSRSSNRKQLRLAGSGGASPVAVPTFDVDARAHSARR